MKTVTHAFESEEIHILRNWNYNQSDDNFQALCGKDYKNESVQIGIHNEPTCQNCVNIYASILLNNV